MIAQRACRRRRARRHLATVEDGSRQETKNAACREDKRRVRSSSNELFRCGERQLEDHNRVEGCRELAVLRATVKWLTGRSV
jgi:hypothetical protein